MTDGARDLSTEQEPAVIADRYRLQRELGRGGAAIVWLARDLVDDRDVAVKILRDEVANTVAFARFLEEIRIDTALTHPRLLPILASGEWKGLLYFVCPYVEGGSLRSRLDRERQLPIDEALRIVKDVADALAYAHAHDIIHRDVKPENILLEGEHALVADFGIARAITRAAGDRITSTGISVGTPAYMSPEQAAGNHDLDQRTDIYSLASVLYEMLAGVAPFVGPTPESVIAQRFVHAPHPLRAYRATVPVGVERAVSCAMAISPADRPRTMGEFADALFRPAVETATTRENANGSSRRRRWVLGGVALAALAASLLATAGRRDDGSDGWLSRAAGTTSASAWRSYRRGMAALEQWNLDAAIPELRSAVTQDPEYAKAQLWLAQAEAWAHPENSEGWQRDATRAASLVATMSQRDSLMAIGVAQLAVQDYPRACATYRRLIALRPTSETGWLGLGQCQRFDPVVVPDPRSPSGYRFRSSYHSATIAYDSAIARAVGAPAFAFSQYFTLLFAESNRVRVGRLQFSDTTLFTAHPSFEADTFAFVPFLAADVAASAPRTLPGTFALALERGAARLRARFSEWVRRSPADPAALLALGYAQEVAGEVDASDAGALAALSTLRSAVRSSSDPDQRIRLTSSIVRVLLKGERFQQAHDAADSLLAAHPSATPAQASYLAGVAALIGEVARTERLLAVMASAPGTFLDPSIPAPVATSVARLTADVALGVCDTGVQSLLTDAETAIERYVPPDARSAVRSRTLARPISLAVPCLGPAAAERLAGTPSRLLAMQRALARGQLAELRAHFDTLERVRRVERAGDITVETTYQEAWLLLAMRDSARAERHLCTPLSALPSLGTSLLRDAPQAAAVGRSFALCAQLAARRGDDSAARHLARALVTLWSTADSSLHPLLAQVRPLLAAAH